MSLKLHILEEDVKAKHALRYFNYVEHHHRNMFEDLIAAVKTDWSAYLASDPVNPNEHRVNELTLRDPDSFLGLELDTKDTKVGGPRFHKQVDSPLSVKISQAFDLTARQKVIHQLMTLAEQAMKKLVSDNPAIFAINSEAEHVRYLFIVDRADDSVRLRFRTVHKEGDEKVDTNKTIFLVATEYGKLTSKMRHFDRVYLIDYHSV